MVRSGVAAFSLRPALEALSCVTKRPLATEQGRMNMAISPDSLVGSLTALVDPSKLLSRCLM